MYHIGLPNIYFKVWCNICMYHIGLPNIYFKVWWHNATLFSYFDIIWHIQQFHHIHTVHLSVVIRRGSLSLVSSVHGKNLLWETSRQSNWGLP
jgi:hypothetical protein